MINNIILDDRFKSCVKVAEHLILELEIPANLNVKYVYCTGYTRHGYCRKEKGKEYDYTIAVNKYLINDKDVVDVLVHELIHTIDGCENHQEQFIMWMKYINEHSNCHITVSGNLDLFEAAYLHKRKDSSFLDIDTRMDVSDYTIVFCPKCGYRFYLRNNKIIDSQFTDYVCDKCKKFFVVEHNHVEKSFDLRFVLKNIDKVSLKDVLPYAKENELFPIIDAYLTYATKEEQWEHHIIFRIMRWYPVIRNLIAQEAMKEKYYKGKDERYIYSISNLFALTKEFRMVADYQRRWLRI